MPRFHIEIDVECETLEQAEQVAAERLGPDEDYGFDYRWDGDALVTANPKGQLPNGPTDPAVLQVFFAHQEVIDRFRRWVTLNGWVLAPMPRFDIPAHHYTPTHMIRPNDAAMRAAGFTVPEKGTTND